MGIKYPSINIKATGVKIKELRKKAKLSINDMADELCVSIWTIYSWECGSKLPKIDNLIAIAALFETTIDDILKTVVSANISGTDMNRTELQDS